MSSTAIVENDTIKLPDGVHVRDGTRVEINFPNDAEVKPPSSLDWMLK